ncbi:MAG: amino acid racemase [Gammaproteobacteria bacterium]|nr:amino acid racemase [Gammaproteobacteria bacterium]
MKHIGIVNITTVGACICANEIVAEYIRINKTEMHPEFSIHSFPFAKYKKYVLERDWVGLSNLILLSIAKLCSIGCDFVIIPSNTPHYAIKTIIERAPVPVLNVIELVSDECVIRGYKKVCVLGTKMTMQGGLYEEYLHKRGIVAITPDEQGCNLIHSLIFDYIIPQKEERAHFSAMIADTVIKEMDCDAVILACTELPDVYNEANLLKPVVDTTRFIAHKAIEFANVTP